MGQGTRNKFDWGLHPEAEKLLENKIDEFLKNNMFAFRLATQMAKETSTRFFDWIDHIALPDNDLGADTLGRTGFEEKGDIDAPDDRRVFVHHDAIFFPVLLSERKTKEVALKPESLDHFVQTTDKTLVIEGETLARYRKAVVYEQDGYVLSAVERRGYNGFVLPEKSTDSEKYRLALESFLRRERHFGIDDKMGVLETKRLLDRISKDISRERATDAFFRAERLYWEKRNRTALTQKARQDRLGLGWGNHDHHTYRSSRKNFAAVVAMFEGMGFVCRERFYAGEKAGWGAQIMEHPVCNFVLFVDVDITKAEREEDFAHREMQDLDTLATVGLWAGLHGESVLQAGMHHLAARFDFERIREDIKKSSLGFMNPFSYFEFLKQAFSGAERWEVEKGRLNTLLRRGSITQAQHDDFSRGGAIAGHLENIQRSQGFKGFNQESVTAILKATDPRKYLVEGA